MQLALSVHNLTLRRRTSNRPRILRNHVASTSSTTSRRYPCANSGEHVSRLHGGPVGCPMCDTLRPRSRATSLDGVDALIGTSGNLLLVAVTIPSWETALDGS